jgi:hypothetical protein
MRVRLVRRPGQHGTRAYVEQYGDRLVCVRYRYDDGARRRYKTIELIVEEKEWEPKAKPELIVGVRLRPYDYANYERLQAIGAKWDYSKSTLVVENHEIVYAILHDRIDY